MYIGIDLGGTKILSGLVSDSGDVLAKDKVKTIPAGTPREIVQQITQSVDRLVTKAGLSISAINSFGIGVPGAVNQAAGTVVFAPNLNWKDVPIRSLLAQEVHKPVILENDVNVGTIGECWKGAGKGRRDVVGMFIGTGVGGALIIDGQLWAGKNGLAGEVGHMIISRNGPECGCGNKGCLEAYVGKVSITRNLAAAGVDLGDAPIVKSSFLAQAIKKDDPIVKAEMKKVSAYLAVGIANIAAVMNPELVILGGGVIEACADYMLPRIKDRVKEISLNKVKIVTAQLGDYAGVVGAAKIARDRTGRPV